MSYCMNRSLGAYYEFSEHEVFPYAGLGATAAIRQTFNAAKVWADAQHGGSIQAIINSYNELGCGAGGRAGSGPGDDAACAAVWAERGSANVAGQRALRAIQEGLNELGYGPVAVDGAWGSETKGAWEQFCLDQNLPSGPGLVNKAGIYKMEQLLKGGESPGPAKAGLPTWGWLLLIAAGVGGVALLAKRKKGPPATGKAMVPMR